MGHWFYMVCVHFSSLEFVERITNMWQNKLIKHLAIFEADSL